MKLEINNINTSKATQSELDSEGRIPVAKGVESEVAAEGRGQAAEEAGAELSTEGRILGAAEREFFSKGFAGARTTSIAEAAGVTHAMLHYYFRSKEKIFEKVIHDKISLLGNLMLESIDLSGNTIFENLEIIIGRHFDFIAANPTLPRFFINEVFADPKRMKFLTDNLARHARSVLDSLQRQIDDAAAKGECRAADAGMLMLDIVSLNIFPFMAAPVVDAIIGDNRELFTERRKRENIDTIIRKLKP